MHSLARTKGTARCASMDASGTRARNVAAKAYVTTEEFEISARNVTVLVYASTIGDVVDA
jgi:hypothetical protein